MADEKKVVVKALVFLNASVSEGEIVNHWGVPFTKKDGSMVAELLRGEADLMVEAGRAAVVK